VSHLSAAGLAAAACLLPGCEQHCRRLALAVLQLRQQTLQPAASGACLLDGCSEGLRNLVLAALFAPGLLGARPSEVAARRELQEAAQKLLEAAASSQPQLLQELQPPLQRLLAAAVPSAAGTAVSTSSSSSAAVLDPVLTQGLLVLAAVPPAAGVQLLPAGVVKQLPVSCLVAAMQLAAAGGGTSADRRTASTGEVPSCLMHVALLCWTALTSTPPVLGLPASNSQQTKALLLHLVCLTRWPLLACVCLAVTDSLPLPLQTS
jgi:hypothetical protein